MKKEINKLKIMIISYIFLKVINNIKYIVSFKYFKLFEKYRNKKIIILTLLPSHGNMGDHAIAYASYKFLKDNFSDYIIIQLDMNDIYKYTKCIKKLLKKEDFIVMIGGGNINNLYKNEEWTRRFIINKFKDVPIISFPQTIFFANDKSGKRELNKTKRIYNKNKNLTLFAREDKSFNTMNKIFTNNVVLENPDMVFYLENMKNDRRQIRNNILVCLRNDRECFINKKEKKIIINNLVSDYRDVLITDTVENYSVNLDIRKIELRKIWNKFFSSKVVITDRLHGMIFAVITQTPCIVIRNSDHKIIESYRWISDLNYIKLIQDISYENIKKNIEELSELNDLNKTKFKEQYFDGFARKIKDIISI